MSVRIIGQIFGSIAGAGAASTGLWFGISKFWNFNYSDESPAELLDEITDEEPVVSSNETPVETPVEPLVENSLAATDAQTIVLIETNTEQNQNTQNVAETQTITSPPPIVSSPKKSKSKRTLGTHITTIENYKWEDEDVQFDWTAIKETENNKNQSYFLAEVQDLDKTKLTKQASKFVLKNEKNEEIINIDCHDLQDECFPIYFFSDRTNNLSDLDLKNLEKTINHLEHQKEWSKYIVFNLVDSTTTKYTASKVVFKNEYNTLNEWKKIYEINGNEQKTLSIVLSPDSNDGEVLIKIKFINFLTPSFTLPESDDDVVEDDGEHAIDSEDNSDEA